MKCAKCGRDNRDNAGFCAWCGSELASRATPAVAEQSGAGAPAPQADAASSAAGAVSGSSVGAQAPEAAPAPTNAGAATEAAAPVIDAQPLPIGAKLAERYEITELLESGPDQHTYRAKDLWACTSCGYEQNKADADGYCEACGAALTKPRFVTLTERIQSTPARFDARFSEAGREYFVTLESVPESQPAPARAEAPTLKLAWGRATDKGLRREHNEDYLETWYYAAGSGRVLGLFVLADGLGGHDAGEVASRMATDVVWDSLRELVWEPLVRAPRRAESTATDAPGVDIPGALATAVSQANKAVYGARTARSNDMSTTLTLALVVDGHAHIANVGDSRIYLWNSAGLRQLTTDHSLVQRLVDAGQLTRDEVYTHPQRNVIYKCIGDRPDVEADVIDHVLKPDDHLLLCSDGLWEMVHDDGIEEVLLSEPDLQRASDRLVANANLAGGEDNISVIIVQALAG